VIFNALQLVDALRWPEGVEDFQRVVEAYSQHRRSIPTGAMEAAVDDRGQSVDVPIHHTDQLSLDERKRVVSYLVGEIRKEDPTWTP
jgi:hypothetical protein